LFAIAYSRLKETQEAEDTVHDVFASLWANRHQSDIQSLENYLATAAKYIVLDKIRKRERSRMYQDSQAEAPVFEMPTDISLHYKRILELIKTEAEKLPERCRLVFWYSRSKGLTTSQIAEELNISPKTVENQLNKALKQLRPVIKSFSVLLWLLSGILFC
jgi:RNA polymerase sigma-70 factor (ECF subfamily)